MKIPEGWRKTRLGRIAKVTSGGTPSRKRAEYWGGTIPWITTSAINFNRINEAQEHITELGLESSSAKIFRPKTLLMAMYGQGITRGRVGILEIEAATNQACAAIIPNTLVNYLFLFYFLSNKYDEIRDLGHGSHQKNLNGKLIKSIPVLLPPLPEQRKIADILGAWDEEIRLTERLIEAKQTYKKGLMQQLLTGKMRFPGFEGEWGTYRLDQVSAKNRYSLTGGPFGSNLKAKDYTDDGVRIIQLQNIGDGKFLNDYKIYTSDEKADELASCNIFPGDIILSKMGNPVARATIIPDKHSRYLMASDGIRLEVDQSRFNTRFVLEALNSWGFRKRAIRRSTGTTRQRIGLSDLRKLTINAPELEEQQKIASVLAACDDEITLLQRKAIALREQKKGLMQQLLTGKVRVV